MAKNPKNKDTDKPSDLNPESENDGHAQETSEEIYDEIEKIKEDTRTAIQNSKYFSEKLFDDIKKVTEEEGEEAGIKSFGEYIKSIPEEEQLNALLDLVSLGWDAEQVEMFIKYFKINDFDLLKEKLLKMGRLDIIIENEDLFLHTNDDLLKAFKKILASGQPEKLVGYIHHPAFKNIDISDFALKLIKAGYGHFLEDYQFDGVTGLRQEVAEELIKIKKDDQEVRHLERYEIKDKKHLAKVLIESGQADYVLQNFNFFGKIDKELIKLCIRTGQIDSLKEYGRNLDKETFLLLVEKGAIDQYFMPYFKQLDKESALKLIDSGLDLNIFWYNKEKFTGLDEEVLLAFLNKLKNKDEISITEQEIGDFGGFTKKVAIKLIEKGFISTFESIAKKIKGLDENVAKKLIEKKEFKTLIRTWQYMSGLSKETLFALLNNNKGPISGIDKHLDNFKNLDTECALRLIKLGFEETIFKNIDKFSNPDFEKIAEALFEKGNSYLIAKHFEIFTGLDHYKTLKRIIETTGDYFMRYVTANLNKFTDLTEEQLKEIIFSIINLDDEKKDSGYVINYLEGLCENLPKLPTIHHEKIAQALLKKDNGKYAHILFDNIDRFNIDHDAYYEKYISSQDEELQKSVIENFHKFRLSNQGEKYLNLLGQGQELMFLLAYVNKIEVDHNKVLTSLIENGHGTTLQYNLKELDVKKDDELAKRLVKKLNANAVEIIIRNIEKFKDLSLKTALYIVNNSHSGQRIKLLENLSHFKLTKEETEKLINEIIKESSATGLLEIYENFNEKLNKNQKDKIIEKAIQDNQLVRLCYSLNKTDNRDFIIQLFIKNKKKRDQFTKKLLSKFPLAFTGISGLKKGELGKDKVTPVLQYLIDEHNFKFNDETADMFVEYITTFGFTKSDILFKYFVNIKNLESGKIKKIPKKQENEGLTTVKKLQEKSKKIRRALIEGTVPDPEDMTSIDYDFLKIETNFETSRFSGRFTNIEELYKDFNKAQKEGDIEELKPGYKEEKLDVKEVECNLDITFCIQEFQKLKKDILNAAKLKKSEYLKTFIEEIVEALQKESDKIEISPEDNPKKQKFLKKRKNIFEKTIEKVKEAKHEDEILKILLEIEQDLKIKKETDFTSPYIRAIIFKKVLKNYSGFAEIPEEIIAYDVPTLEGIQYFKDLIHNVVKQHIAVAGDLREGEDGKQRIKKAEKYYKEGFAPDTKDAKRIVKTMSIPQINEVLKKIESTPTGNSEEIRMIPDRGIVGELSGYYADACWTSQYLFLRDWPQITPYKFIKGKNEEAEIIGSVLFVEAKSEDDEKVLIIRGLNPRDSYLNHLQAESYCEEVFDAAVKTAKRIGAKKVLVAGETGTTSNRPKINDYTRKNYLKEENQIELKDSLNFNNYEIQNKCYVVRELT